ncbi:MAG: HAD family hydrolase [Chloroflexi bacterium]|nr:HAD family hydrolase [Chloroflexota bacterium]
MIEALLLDLDDTLLTNDMQTFIPPYFGLLTQALADCIPPRVMLAHMDQGVQRMQNNDGGEQTNQEAFREGFFAGLDVSPGQVEGRFLRFYEEQFDELQAHTVPKPAARPLVEEALRRGYRVAVATQPIFPLVAVRKRLAWAGLDGLPFDWVCCYETMHACKPRPAFFLEVAERLGTPPQRCLMAGDSVAMDLPAREVGMRTFWVTDSLTVSPLPAAGPADGQGSLEDLYRLVRGDHLRRW